MCAADNCRSPICRGSDGAAAMSATWTPTTADEVLDALLQAAAEGTRLELVGRGTKRGFGRPVRSNALLDLSRLSGIRLYEPDELVMTALPGTPLAEIEAALAAKNQELAFEPPDLGPLYGAAAGGGSIGGAFLCNLAGPRRFKAGAARDHLLGFHAVSGRAERFKAGGRVVKNVTGYDLSKLLCGSFGTLAAATEITFKVLPKGEKVRTLLVFGQTPAEAAEFMSRAAGSPHEVSGATHLPADVAALSAIDRVAKPGVSVTAIRVEGFGPSVEARLAALATLASRLPRDELHSANSRGFWQEVRDLQFFTGHPERALWRLSLAPLDCGKILASLGPLGGRWLLDQAGGVIWFELPDASSPRAAQVRGALGGAGGYATLLRADAGAREATDVFEPEPAGVRALAAGIKRSFDPTGLLNPGRMRADD